MEVDKILMIDRTIKGSIQVFDRFTNPRRDGSGGGSECHSELREVCPLSCSMNKGWKFGLRYQNFNGKSVENPQVGMGLIRVGNPNNDHVCSRSEIEKMWKKKSTTPQVGLGLIRVSNPNNDLAWSWSEVEKLWKNNPTTPR